MMSLRAEGVPRKLVLITLPWAQLLAGTQQPVLSDVTIALPHIAPMKWIPSICEFLHSIGGRMEAENLPVTPLQHEQDWFLMDITLDLYSKPSNLQRLNACRLYLQVTLLSDITTGDGKFIRSEVMQSHRPLSNSATELFPYQSSPNTAGWNLWYTFLTHLTRSPAHALIQPLGRWLHPSHALIHKWQSYIDPSTNIVYLRKQDTFEVYETLPTTPNYEYTRITVSSPLSHSVPIDLDLLGSQITRSIAIPTLVVPPPTTFETYLQSLDQWEYQLLLYSPKVHENQIVTASRLHTVLDMRPSTTNSNHD